MGDLSSFSLDYFSLAGKVAVVTGGNTGLGQGYAVALAAAGADVFITTFDDNWEETRALVEAKGRRAEFIRGDLTDKGFRERVVSECIGRYGKIDILVNNAGTIKRKPILEHGIEDFEAVIEINLNAVYHLSNMAANQMVKQGGGKIINIASMCSFQGGKFIPGYTASKHAVAGITKSFANELAAKNIQINAIAPGYIESANTAPIRADENRNREILSRIPADRWGTPEDLMGTVVFLASRASDYVNGYVLAVDGGWLAR